MRCEYEFKVGLAGPDGLVGDEHWEECGAEAVRVIRVQGYMSGVLTTMELLACQDHAPIMAQDDDWQTVLAVESV